MRRAADRAMATKYSMSMHVHTIPTQTHGRYLVRDGPPERLFLGFHGYAQNAEIHMADLQPIPGIDPWEGVAVQARNRFYMGRSTETSAGWMTRQDRELVIADNINYVRAVAAAFPEAQTILVEGFFQRAGVRH